MCLAGGRCLHPGHGQRLRRQLRHGVRNRPAGDRSIRGRNNTPFTRWNNFNSGDITNPCPVKGAGWGSRLLNAEGRPLAAAPPACPPARARGPDRPPPFTPNDRPDRCPTIALAGRIWRRTHARRQAVDTGEGHARARRVRCPRRARRRHPVARGGGTASPGGAPARAGRGVVRGAGRRAWAGRRRFGGGGRLHVALLARGERNENGNARGPRRPGCRDRGRPRGTTAAYRLARSGVQVRLFEARDRIGGRCWTARGFADGQTAEHGGEFIDTRHVHLRGLAAELGLQLDDLWQGDVPDAISPSWINGGYFDYYDKVNDQLDRITTAVKAAARQVGVIGPNGKASDVAYPYGTATPGARQMDGLNMREWLDRARPRGFPRM